MAGYVGPALRVGEIVSAPPHSLLVQSYRPREMQSGTVNADGYGAALWLDELGERLAKGLHEAARAAGLMHCVARVGSMWTLFFTAGPVIDYGTAKQSDTSRFGRFFWAMIDRGVYLPCSQYEAAFLSALHTEKHIDQTVAANPNDSVATSYRGYLAFRDCNYDQAVRDFSAIRDRDPQNTNARLMLSRTLRARGIPL